jgi:hypothetical protein
MGLKLLSGVSLIIGESGLEVGSLELAATEDSVKPAVLEVAISGIVKYCGLGAKVTLGFDLGVGGNLRLVRLGDCLLTFLQL